MVFKQITIQHTRQVRPYEPVVVSLTADIKEGENPMEVAKAVQEMVLMIAYKDDKAQRDMLINSLVRVGGNDKAVANKDIPNF